MPSFAKRTLTGLFFFVSYFVAGGEAATAVAQAPLRLSDAVRLEVSREWGVGADSITIELMGIADTLPDCCAQVRLGGGSAGWRTGIAWPTDGRPVSFRFRAGRHASIAVAARELVRGDTLQSGDIAYETRIVWGAAAEESQVEPGWVVRSTVVSGEPLTYPDVAPPPLIRAGESVSVAVRRGAVTVTLPGTAIQTAQADEVLQVRLSGGRGIVRGRASAPGLVRVGSL